MFYRQKISNQEKGFTLVETLVSLVILSAVLVPVINLSSAVTRTSSTVRDNLIAAGLAQEGIEVVRAMRDTNWFSSREFDSGLNAGSYQVQWDSSSLLSLAGNPPLNLNNGIYTYSGGTPSTFTRTINITKVNTGELKVISEVSWTERSDNTKSTIAETHLFDWK